VEEVSRGAAVGVGLFPRRPFNLCINQIRAATASRHGKKRKILAETHGPARGQFVGSSFPKKKDER